METLKQFTLAVLGTLGFIQLIDYPALNTEISNSIDLIVKSILSIIAGLLTALLSRLYKRIVNGKQNSNNKTKN